MMSPRDRASNLTAADVMTPNPRTCSNFSTVLEAVLIFRDADCGAVPVLEDGMPVGVLTDRDVALALADHDNLARLPVSQIMMRGVVAVPPTLRSISSSSSSVARACDASWSSTLKANSWGSSAGSTSPPTSPTARLGKPSARFSRGRKGRESAVEEQRPTGLPGERQAPRNHGDRRTRSRSDGRPAARSDSPASASRCGRRTRSTRSTRSRDEPARWSRSPRPSLPSPSSSVDQQRRPARGKIGLASGHAHRSRREAGRPL